MRLHRFPPEKHCVFRTSTCCGSSKDVKGLVSILQGYLKGVGPKRSLRMWS